MAILLNPRIWIAAGVAVFLIAFAAFFYRAGGASARAGLDAYKLAVEKQEELRREANRGRARQVEEKQAAQTATRERHITKTTKEVERATSNLASVPLPADALRLLNSAAQCAREDRPATCGAGDAVPAAK